MLKIILFIFRLLLFIFSYGIYCLNVLFLILKLKNISKYIFIISAYLCSISLGIKYKINNQSKLFLLKEGIHIVNHDSPLDIFIAQCFFQIPTITTVDNHLNKILPLFKNTLINFGHFNFDYLDFNERKLAYNFLLRKSKVDRKILIFPSGSIYTSIKKRFSKSIAKISKSNQLDVIAWKISFEEKDNNFIKYEKNLFSFLFKRFLSNGTIFEIKDLDIFPHNKYNKEEDLHKVLCEFYMK
tara:strand:- start:1534 stop:2256 length:723 start_codon:yes stop_codon:yes gene_type:complete